MTRFGIFKANAWGGDPVVVELGFLYKKEAVAEAEEMASTKASNGDRFVVFEEVATVRTVVQYSTTDHQIPSVHKQPVPPTLRPEEYDAPENPPGELACSYLLGDDGPGHSDYPDGASA